MSGESSPLPPRTPLPQHPLPHGAGGGEKGGAGLQARRLRGVGSAALTPPGWAAGVVGSPCAARRPGAASRHGLGRRLASRPPAAGSRGPSNSARRGRPRRPDARAPGRPPGSLPPGRRWGAGAHPPGPLREQLGAPRPEGLPSGGFLGRGAGSQPAGRPPEAAARRLLYTDPLGGAFLRDQEPCRAARKRTGRMSLHQGQSLPEACCLLGGTGPCGRGGRRPAPVRSWRWEPEGRVRAQSALWQQDLGVARGCAG